MSPGKPFFSQAPVDKSLIYRLTKLNVTWRFDAPTCEHVKNPTSDRYTFARIPPNDLSTQSIYRNRLLVNGADRN
jgi:hypothetical protein